MLKQCLLPLNQAPLRVHIWMSKTAACKQRENTILSINVQSSGTHSTSGSWIEKSWNSSGKVMALYVASRFSSARSTISATTKSQPITTLQCYRAYRLMLFTLLQFQTIIKKITATKTAIWFLTINGDCKLKNSISYSDFTASEYQSGIVFFPKIINRKRKWPLHRRALNPLTAYCLFARVIWPVLLLCPSTLALKIHPHWMI